MSHEYWVTIGVGIPLTASAGVAIAMVIYNPDESPGVYAKRYLHPDEDVLLAPGPNLDPIRWDDDTIALTIC